MSSSVLPILRVRMRTRETIYKGIHTYWQTCLRRFLIPKIVAHRAILQRRWSKPPYLSSQTDMKSSMTMISPLFQPRRSLKCRRMKKCAATEKKWPLKLKRCPRSSRHENSKRVCNWLLYKKRQKDLKIAQFFWSSISLRNSSYTTCRHGWVKMRTRVPFRTSHLTLRTTVLYFKRVTSPVTTILSAIWTTSTSR